MHTSSINADQSLYCFLPAGSTLLIDTGSVRLSITPQFFDGLGWLADICLFGGMVHRMERDAWVELYALQASKVVIQEPSCRAWRSLGRRFWRSLLQSATWKSKSG